MSIEEFGRIYDKTDLVPSVLITSPKGKEKLVAEFSKHAPVVHEMDYSVKLIIPSVDEELPFFASSAQWFRSQGIEVMIASENTIFHCRDKAEFNLFCIRHRFQTPKTWQFNGYLKPRFGKASKGITKFTTSHILQEECPFPEVSVDYFADLRGNMISALPRYRMNVVDGESTAAFAVLDFDLTQVIRLGKELKLVGHNVIQGYWTGETFIFGEVNPRFGGGSHFTFEHFSSPRWLVNKYATPMVREVQKTSKTDL